MDNKKVTVNTQELGKWLEEKRKVTVLDIRPKEQRDEWHIPGSIHLDAYEKLKANDPSILDEVFLPENVPVVTVCAAGRTSMIAANELRKKGIKAYSLEGGMKAWSLAWNTARLDFDKFYIVQVRRTGKGCLSYIIISDNEAVVIDASLPVEVYESLLSQENVKLKFAIDTHIHADHLSRSKQLAEKFHVPLYLPPQEKVTFDFKALNGDVVLTVGNVTITSIKTPGHTLESTCCLVDNKVLITGDTLFINSVGRPDLNATTEETKEKASLLYHSLKKLLSMDDDIVVLPGHTSKPIPFDSVAIQAPLAAVRKNVSGLLNSQQELIQTIIRNSPPTPANHLRIIEKNILGEYESENVADLEAGANRCAIS